MSQTEVLNLSALACAVPPPFECSWRAASSDAATVRASGELDIAGYAPFVQTLGDAQTHARVVLVDLRELTFMDTAGVHAIVNASIEARANGNRLIFVRGPALADQLFALIESRDDVETIDPLPAEPSWDVLTQILAVAPGQ